jgi:hypothetical protein
MYGHRILGSGEEPPSGSIAVSRVQLEHLGEQVDFLNASCDAFDAGKLGEAKRLATTVRVLVHDTSQSKSLLHQLAIKERIPWPDGIVKEVFAEVRKNQAEGRQYTGCLLTTVKLGAGFLNDHSMVKYVPVFEIQPLGERLVSFGYWWKQPRLADQHGTELSRRGITLALANKYGGAHADPQLPSDIESIVRKSSMGVTLSMLQGKSYRDDSPLPAAMRQIAEEVRWSIRRSLDMYLYIDEHLRSMGE